MVSWVFRVSFRLDGRVVILRGFLVFIFGFYFYILFFCFGERIFGFYSIYFIFKVFYGVLGYCFVMGFSFLGFICIFFFFLGYDMCGVFCGKRLR